MRAAAIDVGTNSVKIVVGESDGRILVDQSVITRLGEGLNATGILGADAQARTLNGIRSHLHTARDRRVTEIRVVATSAVREASNSSQFLLAAESELGIRIEVLSEEDEGRLSYAAVALDPTVFRDLSGASRNGNPETLLTVVDIGGGSTEFSFGRGGAPTFCSSLKLGAVNLTERFLRSDPPSVAEIAELSAAVQDAMEHPELVEGSMRHEIGDRVCEKLVGVGGSPVNLARIHRSIPTTITSAVHGAKMSRDEVAAVLRRLSEMTVETRKHITGLDPDRADIIVAGAIILHQAMVAVGALEVTVSTHGLRYGVLYELFRDFGCAQAPA